MDRMMTGFCFDPQVSLLAFRFQAVVNGIFNQWLESQLIMRQSRISVEIRERMTLSLLKRVLSVKVREIGTVEWDYEEYPNDVRANPLEQRS